MHVGAANAVHPAPSDCGRNEPLAHQGVSGIVGRKGLRVREVIGHHAEPVTDQFDRPVEFVGRRGWVGAIEERMCMGVGPNGDEPRRQRLAKSRPRRWRRPPRKLAALVDKRGRHVQRRWEPGIDECWGDHVDEVGSAVVEGDDHLTPVDPVGARIRQRLDGLGETHHVVVLAKMGELGSEGVEVKVDFAATGTTDTVIDQHGEPRCRTNQAVANREHLLGSRSRLHCDSVPLVAPASETTRAELRDQPIRVLWVVKGLGPGGAERLLAVHAGRANHDDFDIECVYVLPHKDHLVADIEAEGVPTRCLSQTERDWRWPVRLAALVRNGNWDVIHVHSPVAGSVARLATRSLPRARRPVVVATEHNSWASHRRPTRWANRLTSRWNDATFAVTNEARASLSGPTATSAVTLSHGIDVERVAALASQRHAVRAELGLDPDAIVIGTVANFRPQKDYPNLVAAARRVCDADPSIRFVAVGQGPGEADTREMVTALGLDDQVMLTGYRPDATRVMAAVDVFVLASRWEGLPVAVMEALALGLPIVATSVGGVAETFTDGVDARLVPANDPAALASALNAVVNDPALRTQLRAASTARSEEFDAQRAIDTIETSYRTGRATPTRRSGPVGSGPVGSGTVESGAVASVGRSPQFSTGTALTIRSATPQDRPAMLELCRAALGWGDDPRFDELFSWKHDDNPFGPSYGWVAVDGDRVVGVRMFMRWQFERYGETVHAVRAVDTAVHPDAQGRGLFTALTTHGLNEIEADGVAFVFNTPNTASLPGYLKMGWQELGQLQVSVHPNGLGGLARAVRSRTAASHWPAGDPLPGTPWRNDDTGVGRASNGDDQFRTRWGNTVAEWRYGRTMLGYRTLATPTGPVVARVRERGSARELAVLRTAGVDPHDTDRAVRAAIDDSGATHATALGRPVGSPRWLTTRRIGPTLAWRAVGGQQPPSITDFDLDLGDIELL